MHGNFPVWLAQGFDEEVVAVGPKLKHSGTRARVGNHVFRLSVEQHVHLRRGGFGSVFGERDGRVDGRPSCGCLGHSLPEGTDHSAPPSLTRGCVASSSNARALADRRCRCSSAQAAGIDDPRPSRGWWCARPHNAAAAPCPVGRSEATRSW